jgi:glycosyltransferase involved in cell wall biosynthesis
MIFFPKRTETPAGAEPRTRESVRADIHVHSKYSSRPSEWFLRRIGAPESFVEPLALYETARARGMDYVTISDHNRIEGALEIAHLPGTFLSCEITTYFPENGCKIHCLAAGFDERQFERISELRSDIHDLRRYLLDESIFHSIAHPLFRVNDRLTVEQVEKLLVMFNTFEGINGTRDRRAGDLVRAVLESLDRETLERMADAHGLEPAGPEPWRKRFTAGSDDHSGLYVGNAHTVTPASTTTEEFLDHLRAGRHEMAGRHGTSLKLARCLYQIGYSYYKERIVGASGGGSRVLGALFRKILGEQTTERRGLKSRVRAAAGRLLGGPRLSAAERGLVEDFRRLFATAPRNGHAGDRQTFAVARHISESLSYAFLANFAQHLRKGRLVDSLQSFSSLGPVVLGIAPYLASFRTQHKDEDFHRTVAERFPAALAQRERGRRRAWLTDTIVEMNGVTHTIRTLAGLARKKGLPLTLVTCQDERPALDASVRNFTPAGTFDLPEYEEGRLALPPFLEMIEYLERCRFGELILSTPGPVGLVGLAASRLLGLKTVGIYHTDLPAYVLHRTADPALEDWTRRFTLWFYDQMDVVFAPSEHYRQVLERQGLEPERLRVLRRGVDLDRFRPDRRDPSFWKRRYGRQGRFTFLYVGRIGREKNIELLLRAFGELLRLGEDADLALVGDGPHKAELERRYSHPRIVFTGRLEGEELAAAYASADAFVFPSLTDTFGNVVLEAQASGLPLIVTDQGGPAETVRADRSGLLVDGTAPAAMAAAMAELLRDPARRARLSRSALEGVRRRSWEGVLDDLWNRGGALPVLGEERHPGRVVLDEQKAHQEPVAAGQDTGPMPDLVDRDRLVDQPVLTVD